VFDLLSVGEVLGWSMVFCMVRGRFGARGDETRYQCIHHT